MQLPVWRELRQSCEWGEFDPCLVVTSDVWVTVLPRVDGPVANACRSLVSEARSVRQKLELSLEKSDQILTNLDMFIGSTQR